MNSMHLFLMVWLACVFPFGVYATLSVYTGRMPRKLPAVVVGLVSFGSPAWAGWPVYGLVSAGAMALGGAVAAFSVVLGLLLGLACKSVRTGFQTFVVSLVLFGLGVGLQQFTSWGWVPMIVSVGIWHFAMGGVLINWLWSLHDRDDIDREPLCDMCGYDLTGLESHICPECGHAHGAATKVVGQPV
jgi:hypothetical protein